MASTKQRQRAQARAKLERQMARRAASARRRRQIQAIVGIVLAVIVVAGGTSWLIWANTDHSKKKAKAAASATPTAGACSFTKAAAASGSKLKDVGTPSTTVPRSGSQTLTLNTSLGEIDIKMDVTHAPCNSASFAYLAGKKFFDNSPCHRLASNPPMLQCGDPSGTGTGGPTYTVNDENLPTGKNPTYPKGTVAVANTGSKNSGSSQFFIMYKDSDLTASYTVLGTVTKGMDVVQKVANGGDDGSLDPSPGGGKPKIPITVKTAVAGKVEDTSASASPSASASASG